MRKLRLLTVILAVPALLAFTLVACGDDDDDDGAAPTATDTVAPLPTDADGGGDGDGDGDTLQLEVIGVNISFSPAQLQAVAGEDFSIVFDNQDSNVRHNLAIFAAEDDATGGGDPIVATVIESGPDTQELAVAGLAAGDYFIWCQIHTSAMTATLTVE